MNIRAKGETLNPPLFFIFVLCCEETYEGINAGNKRFDCESRRKRNNT